jgi:hypothetical protein
VEEQEVLDILSVCLCAYLSSMQSACAVLYCDLRPDWLCRIFSHKRHDFQIKVTEHKIKGVFILCARFFLNISHSAKDSAR